MVADVANLLLNESEENIFTAFAQMTNKFVLNYNLLPNIDCVVTGCPNNGVGVAPNAGVVCHNDPVHGCGHPNNGWVCCWKFVWQNAQNGCPNADWTCGWTNGYPNGDDCCPNIFLNYSIHLKN